MKQVAGMWILDDDVYFERKFTESGGTFENDHLDKALKYVNFFELAIDGGAHYGSWTKDMVAKFNTVLAFEPRVDIFECLQKNITEQNAQLHNEALSNKVEKVKIGKGENFPLGPNANTGCSSIRGEGNINAIPIDNLNLTALSFLKLDIEGYEYYALKGAEQTIIKYQPVIIIEEKGYSKRYFKIPRKASLEFLDDLGYVCKEVLKGRDYIYVHKTQDNASETF